MFTTLRQMLFRPPDHGMMRWVSLVASLAGFIWFVMPESPLRWAMLIGLSQSFLLQFVANSLPRSAVNAAGWLRVGSLVCSVVGLAIIVFGVLLAR